MQQLFGGKYNAALSFHNPGLEGLLDEIQWHHCLTLMRKVGTISIILKLMKVDML